MLQCEAIIGRNAIRLTSIINHIAGHLSVDRIPVAPKITPVHIKPVESPIIPFVDQTDQQNDEEE